MSDRLWFAIEVDRRYYCRFLWTLKEQYGGPLLYPSAIWVTTSDLDVFMSKLRAVLEPIWTKDDGLPTAADLDAVVNEEKIKEATS